MGTNGSRRALVALLVVLVAGCAQEGSPPHSVAQEEVEEVVEVGVDVDDAVDVEEIVEDAVEVIEEVVEDVVGSPAESVEEEADVVGSPAESLQEEVVVEEPEDDVAEPVDAADTHSSAPDVEAVVPPPPPSEPPFWGTVYVTPGAITPASPSDLVGVQFKLVDTRRTFDRRVDAWVDTLAWVYEASYRCGRPLVDVVVNQEFSREQADVEAQRFAFILGQLPAGVRTNVDELWIHAGREQAGGGNRSILVHTEYVDAEWEFVEEIFLHEAAHTSLDWDWGGAVSSALWSEARAGDPTFVSRFAETHPDREDVAESYGAYFIWALHRENGSFSAEAGLIGAPIPGRLAYLDTLGPQYRPLRAGQCS